jgi:molecular chaperone GrpE
MTGKAKKASQKDDEFAELTQDLQRIQADFVNFKRRSEEDKFRAMNAGKQIMVQQLLPVIDNIERALANVPKDLVGNEYVKGIEAVSKQITTALANVGVAKIHTKDAEFNPEFMEAVSMEEGKGTKDVVIEELQPGYIMGDDVIRHAIVKVGRK